MSITTIQLPKNKMGKVEANKSAYNPSDAERDAVSRVLSCYRISYDIRNRTYREFNGYTLLQRQSIDQRTFNAWQEDFSDDPDEAWKSNAVRPIVRNKIISIAAHITGTLITPSVTAQNDNDEEDKDAATVMKDLISWRNDNAEYDRTFLYSVISALVNPAVIVHTEFCKVKRTIKEIQEDGGWEKKDVLDAVLSGFKDTIVPVDEFFIGNIYENDIQKQPWLIWRRFIDYNDAYNKYKDKNNFKNVKPGVHAIYNEEEGTFYEQKDDELEERLVEEVNFYDRWNDLHLVMINGVLMTDPENPIKRIDKKYPFAKTGYELFDEGKFFYYRSLAQKLKPDEEVVNQLYRMTIDGTFMQLMPPVAIFGEDQIDSSVIKPGTVTPFESESKMQKLDVGSNVTQGLQTLDKVEQSISESSNDVMQSGLAQQGSQTAYEVSRLEQNAKVMLGLFSKMIGFMVKDFGDLIISDLLQYMTVAETMDVTDPSSRLKFRKMLVDRGSKTRKIEFDDNMEDEVNENQMLEESLDIMEQEDRGFNPKQEIFKVNPNIFRKRKFSYRVSPDFRTPPSENLKRALNIEAYDRAAKNPMADQEAIFKDLLLGSYETTKDDPDKYVKKQSPGGIESALGGDGVEGNASLANMASMAEQAGVQPGE